MERAGGPRHRREARGVSELEQRNHWVDSVSVSDFKRHRRVTFIDPRFDKQTELRAERHVLDHAAPDGAFNFGRTCWLQTERAHSA